MVAHYIGKKMPGARVPDLDPSFKFTGYPPFVSLLTFKFRIY